MFIIVEQRTNVPLNSCFSSTRDVAEANNNKIEFIQSFQRFMRHYMIQLKFSEENKKIKTKKKERWKRRSQCSLWFNVLLLIFILHQIIIMCVRDVSMFIEFNSTSCTLYRMVFGFRSISFLRSMGIMIVGCQASYTRSTPQNIMICDESVSV